MDHHQRQLVLRTGRGADPDQRGVPRRQPLRRHQTRPRPQSSRLPQHHLVRHAVLRRHGHRSDVLRRCRTGDALHHPTGRRAEHRAGGEGSDEADLLPLGPACLGDLRHRRADPGLLQLSPRPAADPALGAVSADRRTYLRPHRPRGGYLRDHRHRVRRGDFARLRRAADQQRPAPPVRLAGEPDRADRPDRRHLRPRHALGGQRTGPRHPHPVRAEPEPGGDPAALRAGPRADRVPPANLRAEHRGLPVRHRPTRPSTCTPTSPPTGSAAGPCCTGAGGCPGRPSSACSSPVSRAAARSASSSAACCSSRPASPCCG